MASEQHFTTHRLSLFFVYLFFPVSLSCDASALHHNVSGPYPPPPNTWCNNRHPPKDKQRPVQPGFNFHQAVTENADRVKIGSGKICTHMYCKHHTQDQSINQDFLLSSCSVTHYLTFAIHNCFTY